MLNIKVLGPGCMNCINLEKRTNEALAQLNLNSEIEKVTDYSKILELGLVKTPGLIVNDKIVIQGRVPATDEIIEILKLHIG